MPKMSKDPNKPRGKLSPYNIFLKEEREAMKKSETDSATAEADSSKFVNFSKACAEKWKTLSEEGKQPFIEAAAKDKIRYENEMANYTPPKKEEKTRKAKKTKDPNLPKGPKNAFMHFSDENRPKVKEEQPEAPTKEIFKILGEMWRKMSEQEKEPYNLMQKADKERYDEEMKAYKRGEYVVPGTSVEVEAEE